MKIRIKYVLLSILIGITNYGFCQTKVIDSLQNELSTAKYDSIRVNVLIKISDQYRFSDPEKSEQYAMQALDIQKDTSSLKDKKIWLKIMDNIGISLAIRGKYEESIKYFFKVLEVRDRINDKEGVGTSYNNIGNVYKAIEKRDEALTYYRKALDIFKELNNEKAISLGLNNVATILAAQGDNDQALEYYRQSEAIKLKLNDIPGLIYSYNNYGVIYEKMNMLDSALYYNKKAEELLIKEENYDNLLSVLGTEGRIYTQQKKYDLAEEVLLRCIQLSKDKNYPNRLMIAYGNMMDLYSLQENYKDAYHYSKLYTSLKDSVFNIQYEKEIANLNVKYESEKQQQQILLQEEQLRKEKVIRYAIGTGALIIFLLAALIFTRYRVKSKLNKQLHEKNEIIEQKNLDILASINYAKRIQSAILPPDKVVKEHLKKSFVIYKPKDIVAGDFYWVEILPNPSQGGTNKTTSPSDSPKGGGQSPFPSGGVGGGIILFAAADCTGHGVPGAMVSVVCNNALNRSVREHGLIDPGKILDKTREIVVQEFEKSDENVKDGMDIALCKLQIPKDKSQETTLQYAGANNPLWIIREQETVKSGEGAEISDKGLEKYLLLSTDNYLLYETKANKQPIGQFNNPQPYTTHSFNLKKEDTIYLFTDGFVDQFGGENNKKYKAKAFRELLLSIQDKSMEEQRKIIDATFEKWRGDHEQVDDVCIIGVRI